MQVMTCLSLIATVKDADAVFKALADRSRRMLLDRLQEPKAREREGHSIFYKDENGTIFHTYSCYDRGNDKLNVHYHYLDLVPKGRDEGGRGPFWVRRRDEYDR